MTWLFLQLAGFLLRRSNRNLLRYVSQPRMTPAVIANAQSVFPGDAPAHTISMEEWQRRVGVGSIRIACLSNKKIIINLNFYLWHEILIDFSYAGRLRDISEKNEIQQAGEIAKVSQYFMP